MSILLAAVLLALSAPSSVSTFSARPTVVNGIDKNKLPTSAAEGSEGSNKVDTTHAVMRKSRGIPKAETGVYDLYDAYPGSDGRGITIAVMDTGCCLKASGLSGTTSDGTTPKYVDFVDCTGDGDVAMDKVVTFDYATNATTVKGLSGRTLTLGDWAKDATELRLGAVRLFELLPRGVERRVRREREEAFRTRHAALISDAQARLDGLSETEKGSGANDDEEKTSVEKERKELKSMLDQLHAVAEAYEDSGPLMDIVTFEEDGTWKAAIDLEARGDLTDAVPMAPFGHSRQVAELGFGTHVSLCVQVYDGGRTLSLVTDAGSHGTHVAGIAAAYFDAEGGDGGDGDDLNGMAPGARVLALKIGDGRLGSSETGTGLIRGLIAAKKYGCDVINLSYGEPSWQPDVGRVSEVFAKAVNDWGMVSIHIFVRLASISAPSRVSPVLAFPDRVHVGGERRAGPVLARISRIPDGPRHGRGVRLPGDDGRAVLDAAPDARRRAARGGQLLLLLARARAGRAAPRHLRSRGGHCADPAPQPPGQESVPRDQHGVAERLRDGRLHPQRRQAEGGELRARRAEEGALEQRQSTRHRRTVLSGIWRSVGPGMCGVHHCQSWKGGTKRCHRRHRTLAQQRTRYLHPG